MRHCITIIALTCFVTAVNAQPSKLSDKSLNALAKKKFATERRTWKDMGIEQFFLIDYNHDGNKDVLLYLSGVHGNHGIWGFRVYRNTGKDLIRTDELIRDNRAVDSVNREGDGLLVYCSEWANKDPHCCPSLNKIYTLHIVNGKIIGY